MADAEPTNGVMKEEDAADDVQIVEVKEEPPIEITDSQNDEDSLAAFTELEQKIIRQVEYYFSENNLRRDKFMIQKVSENEDGWVELSVLLTFNRLKAISEDTNGIIEAVNKSPHGTVQVSEDGLKIRRHPDNPLPEFNETRRKEVQSRTAYAKGFPLDSTPTTLIDYFNNNFKNVEQVSMRKYFCPKTKKHLFKGSVFVTFANKQASEDFVNKPELKYNEKDLLRYTQSKYVEIKKKEREEHEQKKKAKKAAKVEEAVKEEFKLPKGAVVHFTGVDGEISREDIKEKIAEIDSSLEIAFIHFSKGDKEGDLRFQKEENGKKLLEKIKDGKMTVKDVEITFNLLEGEEEELFLTKAALEIKDRRGNFNKGKGGRGRFNNKRRHEGGNKHYGKRGRHGD